MFDLLRLADVNLALKDQAPLIGINRLGDLAQGFERLPKPMPGARGIAEPASLRRVISAQSLAMHDCVSVGFESLSRVAAIRFQAADDMKARRQVTSKLRLGWSVAHQAVENPDRAVEIAAGIVYSIGPIFKNRNQEKYPFTIQ